jgi:hypothetical protein
MFSKASKDLVENLLKDYDKNEDILIKSMTGVLTKEELLKVEEMAERYEDEK